MAPCCKLKLARFSAYLRSQDGAECGNILNPHSKFLQNYEEYYFFYSGRHSSCQGWPNHPAITVCPRNKVILPPQYFPVVEGGDGVGGGSGEVAVHKKPKLGLSQCN